MHALNAGQIVRTRSRQYLVEAVEPPSRPGEDTLVRLSCLDDDAQGEPLEVLWEREVDAEPVTASDWSRSAARGFDSPQHFSAYLHTLRWAFVTSTRRDLLQAPYRAGIDVLAYQLEPLRKALRLPRVNLFIADDVGLGKTIEAGLILRELLLRQKVRRVVVACPPSVAIQWRDELEARFGLSFVLFDRDYVLQKRRERGYGVNAWSTHSRFIVSHALLRDDAYAGPLRDWLGQGEEPGRPRGTLLILDEAHNAAPSAGGKYASDSHFTHQIRELAPLFEHRLFLSATPHNGHSNSFSALLEILDPQRFCRGVEVEPRHLEPLLVRRLKGDLRQVSEGFPEREVVQLDIDGLPDDAPELVLPRLLDEYRAAREARLKDAPASTRHAATLVITSLQKRLLSSVEAFASTLRVHRASVKKPLRPRAGARVARLSLDPPGADDERAALSDAQLQLEDASQMEAATASSTQPGGLSALELSLLDQMAELAEASRGQPDAKLKRLVAWIREHAMDAKGRWGQRRVLVFTEYADTKRYLDEQLRGLLPEADTRIDAFHGGMDEEAREAVKRAFNADPASHPLRILLATDAAREGVNLQNHCADLFHFDVPWNPSRMEQRNGRLDRKLQREKVVRCHYFVLRQRPEDRVLEVLVAKSRTIERELGSLSPVLEARLSAVLKDGIRRSDEGQLRGALEAEDISAVRRSLVERELEATTRVRQKELDKQLQVLRGLLADAQEALGFDEGMFRDALSCSLQILGAKPLAKVQISPGGRAPPVEAWTLPPDDKRLRDDPTWAETLDTLRAPRGRDERLWDWRKSAPLRPVVFHDTGTLDDQLVHLHLEHRLVQRLLGRFLAQGFVHDDLARATALVSKDPLPRVLLLGRLSLYGDRAARLHDEVIAVAARWFEPGDRKALEPYADRGTTKTLDLVEQALREGRAAPPNAQKRFLAALVEDVRDLSPLAERLAAQTAERAEGLLRARASQEAEDMTRVLTLQRDRITSQLEAYAKPQLSLGFDDKERRQLDADARHWKKRLAEIQGELTTEPERIRGSYEIRARRFDTIGVVYLWPEAG